MLKKIVILVMIIAIAACSTMMEKKERVEIFDDTGNTLYLTRFACALSHEDGNIQSVENTPANLYTIIGTDDSGKINGEWKVSCSAATAGGTAPCKVISGRMSPSEAGSLSCAEISNFSIVK